MRMGDRNVIELEQGWTHMRKGIAKLKNILEGIPEQPFTSDEYSILYTTIYNMCTQKFPFDSHNNSMRDTERLLWNTLTHWCCLY